jgi:hypothetical protein
MKTFVHIGYPKNFSTSLQRNFFSMHPDVFHLGIGIESNLGYCDEVIDTVFELYLKSCKRFLYDRERNRLKQHIHKLFIEAKNSGREIISMSSEHLSFSFSFDGLDFVEKMKRMKDLFGNDLHFIMIIRNQFEVFKSLYRESVRVGYAGTFAEYIYAVYKYQDRSFYYDFSYDLVLETIQNEFGKNSCSVFLFEDYRDEQTKGMVLENGKVKLVQDLAEIMGVNYLDVDFEHFNEALSNSEISIKSRLNKETRHDLGEQLYGAAEKHRLKNYLIHDLKLHEEESVMFEDVLKKRALIMDSKKRAAGIVDSKLDYSCNSSVYESMKNYFEKANVRFMEISGKVLPDSYFNLNF